MDVTMLFGHNGLWLDLRFEQMFFFLFHRYESYELFFFSFESEFDVIQSFPRMVCTFF